jgi:hypothetical protein
MGYVDAAPTRFAALQRFGQGEKDVAETPELTKIDLTLRSNRLIVDWLPEVATLWDTWDEDVQCDFTLEWAGLMDHLTYVTDEVAAGRATSAQVDAYRRLQADLIALAPILEKLGLHVLPEFLTDAPRAAEAR